MANKTPVRVVFDSSNVATGLAEMQSGETVGPTHGGTGLATLGTAGHVLRMNAGGTAIEFAALEDLADITSIGSTLTAPSNADFQITTAGTGNIVLNDISISDNSIRANRTNDDLVLQGSGSGAVSIKGAYVFPNADGSVGQFLKTDGSGTLAFAELSVGDLVIVGSSIASPSNADLTLDPAGTGAIKLNANTDITGNLTVTGTLDLGDSNFTNVGSLQLDSIAGDGDTNTSITFSGSDVITIATGGSGRLTVGDGALSPVTDSQIDLGTSSLYYKDAYIDSITTTGNVSIGGNLDVTGTLDLSDSNFTNVGSLQLDSIAGDGDTNTSVTFSGSDVITVATGGSTAATFNADQSVSLSGALTVTGTVTMSGGQAIPGKLGGTNFTDSLLIGHSTTGTLNSANFNTGVGTGALDALTSGDSNSAFGNIAGSSITSGVQNTAIGDGALPNVTSTLSNVGVGYQAGKNGTGNRNIYIGENAGRHHSSGDGKVIIGGGDLGTTGNTGSRILEIHGYDGSTRTTWISGDSSGKVSFPGGDGSGIGILSSTISTAASNSDINITPHGTGSVVISQISTNSVTGDVIPGKVAGTNFDQSLLVGSTPDGTLNDAGRNTGVGFFSMQKITTGDDNTALGWQSLRYNRTGVTNTAIGNNSMGNTGNAPENNTATGHQSLKDVQGNHNVALGSRSGRNITTGSGSLILGDVEADSATADRQLKIAGFDGTNTTTWISGDSSGNLTFPGTVSLATNKAIQFVDANESVSSDGTNLILTSGGTAFKMPIADGNAGDVLKTDGSGTMSFASAAATASDDSRATVKNNKSVSATARTIDFFQATGADMVWYFMALTDLTNDHSSASVFTVCHNNSDAFAGGPRGGASGTANSLPSSSADISSGQVRVKIAGPSADGKISFYKIPISRANTTDETSGVTITTSNTDVDSASESIDTFAHASFRAAKYTILVDDNAKTETGVTEALVVHDGTNAFIVQYGTVNTGNNDMITLSAAISGANVVVSAAGLTPNLSLKTHKTLLSDSMTAEENANQKIIGATTVSSAATAFDSIDVDDASAAVYYIVGKNATEGVFSVQEVYLTGAPGEAGVAQGPFVSSKETTQLEFTSAYLTTTDNSVGLSISSTSGGSTVVNAYRINCLAE